MNKKIANAQHAGAIEAEPLHQTLRSRATAALTAGCLALTLCPAVALAAPGDTFQQDGNQPAMQQPADMGQQGPQGQFGQMGAGESDQQAPQGQPGQMGMGDFGQQGPMGQPGQMPNDGMDDQVRQVLSDSYDVDTSFPAPSGEAGEAPDGEFQPGDNMGMRPGNPEDAPELPEGTVNVQKVIDSVRDAFRMYGIEFLENGEYTSDFDEAIQNASTEREAQFASGEAPTMSDKAPEGTPSDSAPSTAKLSDSAFSNLVDRIMTLFGYNA